MAQKFVEVTGLHNVFSTAGGTLDLTTIINDKANFNSILFMTADSTDEQYGYPENSRYIWTRNKLYPTNDGGGSSSDEKVKVRTSTVSAGFPLMAVATSSPVDGNTYTAIYDSGIVIDPSLHSVAEGIKTETQNEAEHAEGRYNISHTNSIHTTGIGTSTVSRKNAFEIIQDGSTYLYGVGNYDGSVLTDSSTLQQVINGAIQTIEDNEYTVTTALNNIADTLGVDSTDFNVEWSTASGIPTTYSYKDAIELTAIKTVSVLTYKGTVGTGGTTTSLPDNHKQGDVWVCCSAGSYAGKTCEPGDYIICNTTRITASNNDWDVITGENQILFSNATLASPGSSVSYVNSEGTTHYITTPSDWKVTDDDYQVYTTTSNSTVYLSGKTTTAASTASEYVHGSVYMNSGNLYSNKFITSGGSNSLFVKGDGSLDSNSYMLANKKYWANVELSSVSSTTTQPTFLTATIQNDSTHKCTMYYDSTEECMKFSF